ncbi:MAG: glycosyltransferase family 4 protein [Planctomycetaceae bacterium]
MPSNPKRRVLHLVPSIKNGGAEKVAFDLASYQKLAGHEVLVVSIAKPEAPPAWHRPRHVAWNEVRNLDWLLSYTSLSNLTGAKQRLQAVLKEFQPDILHSHLWVADIVASLSVGKSNTQHIAHIHNQEVWKDSPKWRHSIRRAATRWLYRRSLTRFIACSPSVKEYEQRTMGWQNDHMDVVRNSTELEEFRPTTRTRSERIRIGSAGWFIPRKGHLLLIDAVARLVSEGLNLEIVLAGDGPLREEYLRRAAQCGIADRMILPGPVSNMESFYHSIDIFALTSYEEGLPLVVIEAMASGLCVVAASLFGMEDVIHPNTTGVLFPPGNTDELTNALRRVINDPDLSSSLGTAARTLALEQFSLRTASEIVEQIYQKRISERLACPTP